MGVLEISSKDDSADKPAKRMSRAEIEQKINQLTREMREAAKILEFEHAAFLRDRIEKLRQAGGKENQALSTDKIVIKGAREHNLKNVDVTIPRDKLIVMTGLSGSGKSSLAFDTIYADGQRRYMESLSSYARQFLGQMEKPDVDEIQACRRPYPSTRKRPPATRAPQWAR